MPRWAVAVAALVLTVAGAVLLPRAFDSGEGGGDGGSGSAQSAPAPNEVPQPVATPPPTGPVADDLAVLRRTRGPADALPADIAEVLGADARTQARWAPELGESRRLPVGPRAAWAVPGHGYICIVVNAESKFAHECEMIRRTRRGELRPVIEDHGTRTITGLVPDATTSVLLETDDGRSRRLTVRDNAYGAAFAGEPVRLSFTPTGSSRTVVVRFRRPGPG